MPEDNLGAWTGDSLEETVESYEGTAYYDGLDDSTRFMHGVAKMIRRRLAKNGAENEKAYPAIFILGTPPENLMKIMKAAPRLDSGMDKLSGYVWFLSREPRSGRGFVPDFASDEALFNYVISTLKAGEMPSVIFDAKESVRTVRFYAQGMKHMDDCQILSIDGADINPNSVHCAIDNIYDKRLVTAEAGAHNIQLWKDKDKHYPIERPEAEIQSHIVTGLASKWVGLKIKEEQTGVSGRYDISITEQIPLEPSKWIEHALLELKVIKTFKSTGKKHTESENRTWLKDGLDQAYCYRKENGSKFAALCCFDMQKENNGESCFNHINEEAKKLLVLLWHWYIYAKSKKYRIANAAKAKEAC